MDINLLKSIMRQILEDIDRGKRLEFGTPRLNICKTSVNNYGIELIFEVEDGEVPQIEVDKIQTEEVAQELGEFIQYVLCKDFNISLDLYNSVSHTFISKSDILKVARGNN